jgi:hypothetical protein
LKKEKPLQGTFCTNFLTALLVFIIAPRRANITNINYSFSHNATAIFVFFHSLSWKLLPADGA